MLIVIGNATFIENCLLLIGKEVHIIWGIKEIRGINTKSPTLDLVITFASMILSPNLILISRILLQRPFEWFRFFKRIMSAHFSSYKQWFGSPKKIQRLQKQYLLRSYKNYWHLCMDGIDWEALTSTCHLVCQYHYFLESK